MTVEELAADPKLAEGLTLAALRHVRAVAGIAAAVALAAEIKRFPEGEAPAAPGPARDGLLTETEAATLLNVSRTYLVKQRKLGALPFASWIVYVGTIPRYSEKLVRAHMEHPEHAAERRGPRFPRMGRGTS